VGLLTDLISTALTWLTFRGRLAVENTKEKLSSSFTTYQSQGYTHELPVQALPTVLFMRKYGSGFFCSFQRLAYMQANQLVKTSYPTTLIYYRVSLHW